MIIEEDVLEHSTKESCVSGAAHMQELKVETIISSLEAFPLINKISRKANQEKLTFFHSKVTRP